jgi:hypothetical protein
VPFSEGPSSRTLPVNLAFPFVPIPQLCDVEGLFAVRFYDRAPVGASGSVRTLCEPPFHVNLNRLAATRIIGQVTIQLTTAASRIADRSCSPCESASAGTGSSLVSGMASR